MVGIRRTTLAARLKAIYGSVDKLDAFVGMLSERHVPGTEFGRLQLAIWKRQFEALRDGDRFFYRNDPALATIRRLYGIDYRRTLAGLIRADAGVAVQADSFKAPLESTPASTVTVATPAATGCDGIESLTEFLAQRQAALRRRVFTRQRATRKEVRL